MRATGGLRRVERHGEGEQLNAPERGVVDLDERAWLARHLRGDARAFPELLAAYQGPVWRYIGRCGVRGAAREDLLQEVFLKIHAAAASYQPARPLRPWIFTIAANTVRNHVRDRRDDVEVPLERIVDSRAAPGAGLERQAAADETLGWLEGAIASLPLAQREVLLLVSVEGLALAATADLLGLPLNTVKTRLRRARLALSGALARRDGEELP